MIDIQVEATDLAEIFRRLDKLQMPDLAKPALTLIGQSIQSKVKVYPPTIDRATSMALYGRWYKRGTGTILESGKTYFTSEKLGERWYRRVFSNYVEVGNLASYAGWVHGPDQVPYHKERGWKQLLVVATEELPELLRKILEQITRIWEGRQ